MALFHSVMTEIIGLVTVTGCLAMWLSAALDTLDNRS
jgi:hypothetical protein